MEFQLKDIYLGKNLSLLEQEGSYPRKTTLVNESISDLFTKLPQDFFLSIQKSYLVPLEQIIGISAVNVMLENHKISLGLTYWENFSRKKFKYTSIIK